MVAKAEAVNPLIAFHLTMAAWHAAWAAFWLGHSRGQVRKAAESEPDSGKMDTTADSADRYVRGLTQAREP